MAETTRFYKYIVLALACLIMVAFNFSQMSLAPMMGEILKDLPFSNSEAGILMGASTACGIVLAYFISLLANKYQRKTLTLLALVVMAAGVALMSRADGFFTMLVGRLIAGVGSTALIILTPLFITTYFEEKAMGRAMSIFVAAQPLGIILALNILGRMGVSAGWRPSMLLVSALIGVVCLLSLVLLRRLPASVSPVHRRNGAARGSAVWLLAVVYAVFTLAVSAYLNFGPRYFGVLGLSVDNIGLLASLIMILPLVLSPFVGILLDSIARSRKRAILGLSGLLMAGAYVGIGYQWGAPLPWAVLLGVGFAFVGPICYSIIPEILPEHRHSIGMGMLIIAFDVGGSLGPILFGGVLDASGGVFAASFSAVAVLLLLILPAIYVLRIKENAATASTMLAS